MVPKTNFARNFHRKKSGDLCVQEKEGRDASENKFFVLAMEHYRFRINRDVNKELRMELDFQLKYLWRFTRDVHNGIAFSSILTTLFSNLKYKL